MVPGPGCLVDALVETAVKRSLRLGRRAKPGRGALPFAAPAESRPRKIRRACLTRTSPGAVACARLPMRSINRTPQLHALALTRTDQSRNIERAHPSVRLVAQMAQERRQPTPKLVLPVCIRHHRFVSHRNEASGESLTIPRSSTHSTHPGAGEVVVGSLVVAGDDASEVPRTAR